MSVLKQSILGESSKLYAIWAGIKTRCYNPNSPNYKNYGARGIAMCDEWQCYPKFEEWALNNGYDPNCGYKELSIERIDNNANYSPENCIWATPKTQMNNTRRNVFVTYKGERKTLSQWADSAGIRYSTFMSRYGRGWGFERIINTPVGKYERRLNG